MKKNWFVAEYIPKINYTAMLPVFAEYGRFIRRLGGGDYFNKLIWIFRDGNADLCYIRNDFDNGICFLLKKVIKNPAWAEKINKLILKTSKEYISFARKIENNNFSDLSDHQLFRLYWQLVMNYQRKSHNSGQITTWLIDAEKNLFSNYLLDSLKQRITKNKLKFHISEVFAILTTPDRPGYLEMESRDALKIVITLNKDIVAKKIFLENETKNISKKLKLKKPKLERLTYLHYKKYKWLHYTYQGPILGYEYFLEIWKGILKQHDLGNLQNISKNYFPKIKSQRAELFRKLKFSPKDRRLFDIAQEIVYLKAFRKDCMYFGSYVADKISNEIAKRVGLSLKQVRYLAYWEVVEVLKNKKFDANILNKRHNFSIIYTDSVKPKIYIGKKAEKFFKSLKFEKHILEEINDLKGMTVYHGKISGIVKIVETTDDLKKMNQGDILLSETTYPALVPAMKKAGAIVTNVGGLTCHAAIVARELKIPCIVGTKIATKIFKDGDRVVVDTSRGIIKKIL